jgi:hypothetical protein
VQSPNPAECRHSRAGFHCTFTTIASRRHLSDAAKLLHAALVSMVRRRLEWTQSEIAEQLGWTCRQKVWRAADELVADGLLTIRRRGLGLPNEYLLLPTEDVHAEDIAARAPRTPGDRAGHQEGRIPNTPARAFNSGKKTTKKRPEYGHKDFDARNYYETSDGSLITRT